MRRAWVRDSVVEMRWLFSVKMARFGKI
jgi:hypothetical protein